ncbi:hypothetical protein WA1_46580 [Scytonema hofmannii PCC 7110]|uniref:Isopropylmalate/homocitrate/citramalate synthase n=1 Tax=Scytonema hofmannii PCC 7110 TaxID=128403 RepID=A0A139WXG9_9CYAN|nr:hypothetical protein [Scytonema hofmannii]KYC37103.1 hypothetical protein WA1_46580 [Scytonema hofmannii PCC 7110]
MTQTQLKDLNNFLYSRRRYYGQVKPENLVFNANLQEFAQKVTYITCLKTGGKLAPEEAYKQIETLWEQLERRKYELVVGINSENDVSIGG